MKKVNLFWPNILKNEWLKELEVIFESKWIAQAGKVTEFEKKFGEKFGYKYCVAMNSGTAAISMALHLLNIQNTDMVLSPVLTCTATNIPVVHRGTTPVFIDINQELTMDYDHLVKVSQMFGVYRPSAVITVNLGGLTCDQRIYDYCKENNIPVIVDACQSLGIPEPNGDFVCYSFQAIKHFTTGDGGMLVCRNEEDYERAKKLRWFGIDREMRAKKNFNFGPSDREMCMNMDEPGFKSHMNDIQATMGLVGLNHSDKDLHHRKELANIYRNELKYPTISGGSYWLMGTLISNRDKKMDRIKEAGVECDLVHLRNDIFTPFGSKRGNFPNMNRLEKEYLYIPMHNKLTQSDIEYVCEVINAV